MRKGDVWLINLDPTIGAEIKKTRPAVIVSEDAIGARHSQRLSSHLIEHWALALRDQGDVKITWSQAKAEVTERPSP